MKKNLTKKEYFRIFLLYGIVYATIPIIFTEIMWDIVFDGVGFKVGLCRELLEYFFRAALIEEIFKFYGFIKANREYQFKNEKEYMIGAGMIGLAYGIIEKIASGNAIAIVLGIVFPMHFLWQMNQGRNYYKYIKDKDNNNKNDKKELFIATIFIFLMHGCWDALISLVSHFANESKNPNADMLGGILLIMIIIIGLIYIVVSIIKIRKVLKNNKKNNQIYDILN